MEDNVEDLYSTMDVAEILMDLFATLYCMPTLSNTTKLRVYITLAIYGENLIQQWTTLWIMRGHMPGPQNY